MGPPSLFSNDIWLGDNLGESLAFSRDVKISGWTNVGDKPGGAYVGEPILWTLLLSKTLISGHLNQFTTV